MKKNSSTQLLEIYHRLFVCYGTQHWWPAEDHFEVMVGAILTQSASWQNVEKAIVNLKNAGVMTPAVIRDIPAITLAKLLRPAGYYNAKAIKLQALANWLSAVCGDNLSALFTVNTDEFRKQLLNVHGIIPETADSILLYAAQKPVLVIDTYTRRIIGRLALAPACTTYDDYQTFLTSNLPREVPLFNEYHALLVRLAKENCKTQPLCTKCCPRDLCHFQNLA